MCVWGGVRRKEGCGYRSAVRDWIHQHDIVFGYMSCMGKSILKAVSPYIYTQVIVRGVHDMI